MPADRAVTVAALSPSTARNDRGRKRRLMARYGVPEYWVLDPLAKTIELSRLTGIDLADLFADGLTV